VRASGALTIGPDLIVSALTAPATAAIGGTFAVSDTTKNQGASAAGETTTRFYLSTNSSLNATDPEIGGRTVPPLPAGISNQVTNTTVTVPASTAVGTYYVIAQADATGAVPEASESNNTRVSAAVKIGPDLTVSALTAPASAAAGATIDVTDTTKNLSSGPVVPSSTGFYLSKNGAIDATDTFLGSRAVGSLAANGSETASASLQIPPDTTPGTHYVIARADYDGAIAETTETNNDKSRSIVIGGDLVVTANTAPATGMPNGAITVTDTTRNQGAATIPPSSTGFYLSTNGSLSANDVFLGSRTVSALAPSTSEAGSMQVTIPANTTPGSYYVVAVADWNGAVLESQETNNTRSSSAIRIGPDLTVTALTAPTSAVAGTTITANDTTMNQGGEATPASITNFYLSTNSTLDAGDQLIGTRQLNAVGAGQTSAGSALLTVPTTAAGTHYIIAKADGNDAIQESSEVNNTRVRTITIAAAP
jgi:subtilase family serine protease